MQTVAAPKPLAGLDPLALAGGVCARICHDLAGSLGALTAALEIAAEEGDREALDLAVTVSRELGARLRLLRAAWGAGSDVPAPATLLAGLPGAERLTLDTKALTAAETESLRLSLSLLLVAATALPRGGHVCLRGTDAHLTLEIEGARATWPEALSHCLASDTALVAACDLPRSMASALVCLQARGQGRVIRLESASRLHVMRDGAPP